MTVTVKRTGSAWRRTLYGHCTSQPGECWLQRSKAMRWPGRRFGSTFQGLPFCRVIIVRSKVATWPVMPPHPSFPGGHTDLRARLYVGGLPGHVSNTDVADRFSPFGKVLSCELVPSKGLDAVAGTCRGFAYVNLEFKDSHALARCISLVCTGVLLPSPPTDRLENSP
jgi:hypothetical protein